MCRAYTRRWNGGAEKGCGATPLGRSHCGLHQRPASWPALSGFPMAVGVGCAAQAAC